MKTTTQVLTYSKSQDIEADGCFAITFTRITGSNPVKINGFPLTDGGSFSVRQNVGDQDYTTYNMVFFSGAGANECIVSKIMPLDKNG